MVSIRRKLTKVTPTEITINRPKKFNPELYKAGYEHGINGRQLCKIEHFKASFRYGFRAAKLELKEIRRQQGILTFPVQGRVKVLML